MYVTVIKMLGYITTMMIDDDYVEISIAASAEVLPEVVHKRNNVVHQKRRMQRVLSDPLPLTSYKKEDNSSLKRLIESTESFHTNLYDSIHKSLQKTLYKSLYKGLYDNLHVSLHETLYDKPNSLSITDKSLYVIGIISLWVLSYGLGRVAAR